MRRKKPERLKSNTPGTILDTAEKLCAAKGIDAVSIRDVAAAAGVSIPTIYHHFRSRAELLRAIVRSRFGEILQESEPLLTAVEAKAAPSVREILLTLLQPISSWRKPGREASLQFQALALVCALPAVKKEIDRGVAQLGRHVALLQRALPELSREEICWRLHFTMKLTHQTTFDYERLDIMSGGTCRSTDIEEALDRALHYAEAAFRAPPSQAKRQIGRKTARRPRQTK